MTMTVKAQSLQPEPATPTLGEAMEPLRLFMPETLETTPDESAEDQPQSLTPVPTDHLTAAEAFLEARAAALEPLPTIQAAILLCEGIGDISETGLEGVRVDERAFPRSAAASRVDSEHAQVFSYQLA
jgi:hypothetical protein